MSYSSGLGTGDFMGLFLPKNFRAIFKQRESHRKNSQRCASVEQETVKNMRTMVVNVEETLKERGNRYGSFKTHAEFAEMINAVYEHSDNWKTMKPDAKESLRIIANKIGRILNGDPEYDDNWRDIAGYATLVLQRINNE